MASMYRRTDKGVSPSGKASSSELKTHMQLVPLATSEIISRWLLTGLAVVLSRPNWPLLAKKGTLTSTSQELLQKYNQGGCPAGLKDRIELPYALPKHNAIIEAEWCRRVGLFLPLATLARHGGPVH